MSKDVQLDFERLGLGRQRASGAGETIRWRDMGLAAFVKAVANLDSTRIKIGVVGDKADQTSTHDPRLTVGELALIMEYGTSTIPARPFINGVIHPITALIASSRVASAIVRGQSPHQALQEEGEKFALFLRNRVRANQSLEPNAESTAKKKGFDHPLIDTGQLVDAIWFEITEHTEEEVLTSGLDVEER